MLITPTFEKVIVQLAVGKRQSCSGYVLNCSPKNSFDLFNTNAYKSMLNSCMNVILKPSFNPIINFCVHVPFGCSEVPALKFDSGRHWLHQIRILSTRRLVFFMIEMLTQVPIALFFRLPSKKDRQTKAKHIFSKRVTVDQCGGANVLCWICRGKVRSHSFILTDTFS